MSETPLFVVVLIGADTSFAAAPRAIGPFDSFDVAQAFAQTLTERFASEGTEALTATVVRLESDQPGVVVGEL